MRFKIRINDGEEGSPDWRKKLKPFKFRRYNTCYTIELNSWGAFAELQRVVGCEARVYSTDLLSKMNTYSNTPMIKFRTDEFDEDPEPNNYYLGDEFY